MRFFKKKDIQYGHSTHSALAIKIPLSFVVSIESLSTLRTQSHIFSSLSHSLFPSVCASLRFTHSLSIYIYITHSLLNSRF